MVHALEEIRRTLIPDGVLIDLRPVSDRWPVELVLDRTNREMGRLIDIPAGLAVDEAANNAFKEVARRGWFICESEQIFPFFYYWDTPEEMKEHIKEKWSFMQLEDSIYSALENVWSSGSTYRRVRVQVRMLLTRWRKG